jgi:hypothetical protein
MVFRRYADDLGYWEAEAQSKSGADKVKLRLRFAATAPKILRQRLLMWKSTRTNMSPNEENRLFDLRSKQKRAALDARESRELVRLANKKAKETAALNKLKPEK